MRNIEGDTHSKVIGYIYDFWTLNDQLTILNGEQ
jgi:hypothetical protein